MYFVATVARQGTNPDRQARVRRPAGPTIRHHGPLRPALDGALLEPLDPNEKRRYGGFAGDMLMTMHASTENFIRSPPRRWATS